MTANENPFENELTGSSESAPPALESKTGESLKYCKYTVDQVIEEFQTDGLKGLCNSQDIVYRRSVHGPNEMEVEEEESLFSKFLSSFYSDPLILLLMGSAVISFLMSNIDDAISITMAITIVVTVGFVQEYRSEKSLEALNKLVPAEAHLTRNGNTETVLAANLVPGDLVDFSVGDRIPADVRIIHSSHLTIDESNLTGENLPVSKDSKPVESDDPNIPLNQRSCIGFMGTLVRDGNGKGIVIGTAKNTAFGSVFEMMSSIEKPKTPLQQAMDKLGKDLSAFSFGIIGLICLVGVFQGRPWLEMFQISVSLAVAAIPEGLPIIVTVTLALGVLRMAKQRAIVKRLPSVETLGSVNVICSDKTGTLTQNHMTVNRLWTVDMGDEFLKIEQGESYANYLKPDTLKVLQTGNIVNNAKYSNEKEKYIGNPTDIAIIESLEKFDLQDIRATKERMLEIPFSSSKKYQAVSVHSGDKSKSEIFVKGALNKVLERCSRYYNAEGIATPLTDELKKRSLQMADTLASSGLRILSFAHDKGNFEETGDGPSDMIFCGLLGMNDPPRPSVSKSILKFMRGGVHIIMITGDSESTAVAVAKQVGMVIDNSKYAVLSGDDIDAMSTEQLAQAISHCSVFARTTPKHKVSIVRALQARGDIVAMTGDGVNDAPALKLADIGIAMGNMGTDVAKEAADMVLTDDDFSTILSAIQEGKGIFYNIQNFLTFQLSTSIAALSLIALSTAFNLPNPLNAMQILWINIIMDGPPAQSLGVEPVDKAVMNKPPRKRNDKILTSKVIQRVIQSSFIIVCGTLYVYMHEIKDNEVTARDTTMTFTCFVFFDMFNALTTRHHSKSIAELGWSNTMFNFSVAASILGQLGAIYIPFLQSIFQTEPLSLKDLVHLLLLSSSVWIVDELRKLYVRRRDASPYNGYSMAV